MFQSTEDIVEFLWRRDEFEYSRPRMRSQLAWIICTMSYAGFRQGEIVESVDWLGLNEGIHYRDVDVQVSRFQGALQYSVMVRLRNRKGQRGGETWMSSPFVMESDPSNWYTCPVMQFLGFALADDVYDDLSNITSSMKLPQSANSHTFQMKAGKEHLPVCRRAKRNGSISPDRIMTGSLLWKYLKDVGYRCGYKEQLSGYAFRRGCGNQLEGPPPYRHCYFPCWPNIFIDTVTVAQRRQVMGHEGKFDQVFQKYYASDIIGIDLASVVRGRSQNQEYIDFMRSITFGRDTNAPVPAGSLINEIPYVVSEEELEQLRVPYPNQKRNDLVKKAKKSHFETKRTAFFTTLERHQYSLEGANSLQEGDNSSQEGEEKQPSYSCKVMLKYDHDRRAVIESFWSLWSQPPKPLGEVLRSLQAVADPSARKRHYYPGAEFKIQCFCPNLNRLIRPTNFAFHAGVGYHPRAGKIIARCTDNDSRKKEDTSAGLEDALD
ncbi:uncharacterized protein BDZ99DRAFT_483318 [Mytilinidion resinicola]|uniref:Uncharacterized protein n=1 Tax=Mytilinidion resinicola TaxID=574789 RepID=A0A6A6XZT3_9PEZI|nr:uncharacterized protein BDZ99DRAFT_483318 [Mytilinidion resinicola]KAF2802032.1 hypothetical protein BDZ99DRAFT_483318 [Mytilinidion resinicola]